MSRQTKFQASHEEGFERITLHHLSDDASTIGDLVNFDEWFTKAPPTTLAAIDPLLGAWADGRETKSGQALVDVSANSMRLHPEAVAALSDAHALALGLPRATTLTLELNGRGIFPRQDFQIEKLWLRPGNRATRVTISGARLTFNQKHWRIPEPMFATLSAADKLNASTERDEKQCYLAELRTALDIDNGTEAIQPDLFLSRLRVKYAAGFSLDLKTGAHGFDFDPVLFAPAIIEGDVDDKPVDQFEDNLLTQLQSEDFQKQFRHSDGARKSFVLGDGSLLFLDPLLSKALTVVREAQQGDADTRKDFARSPQRRLREALEEDFGAEGRISEIFVETTQYSDRVAGIDIWRQPVLPWIKPSATTWLPEKFGFRVGEGADAVTVELPPEDISRARSAVEEAIARGQDSAVILGVTVPATPKTLEVLGDLEIMAKEVERTKGEGGDDVEDEQPPASLRDRYFLQISDNLEEITYAPLAPQIDTTIEFQTPVWPAGVISSPKSYQTLGFGWLSNCYQSALPGCLLADDMGLGKTFQALSFMAWLRQCEGNRRPFLIVAPSGLLANWEAEISLHLEADTLGPIVRAYGNHLGRIRLENGPDIKTAKAGLDHATWEAAGVVLTTFETMRDYHMSFARQKFGCIIYDEVQKLKNPASQVTRAAKTLNADFQVAMTGTPVENRLQDLWSIIDVVHPGWMGSSKAFEQSYPAEDSARLIALNKLLTEPQGSQPPFMLRRMKDQSLDGLPEKTIEKIEYEMPPEQAREYLSAVNRALVARDNEGPGRMLEVLHRLRGVSLHPYDPLQASNDTDYFDKSARTRALFDRLDKVQQKGEKALIFCESLAMQSALAGALERRYRLPDRVARIHGGLNGDQRQQIVDEFQSAPAGFRALIISPKAGGVGLTLTAANHVFHLSRWWNPAVEDQATDRAYRLGQSRKVFVYILQAVHPDPAVRAVSFDKKLDELIERKRSLSGGLLMPGERSGDVANLFGEVIFDVPEVSSLPNIEPQRPPLPDTSVESSQEEETPKPKVESELECDVDDMREHIQPVASFPRRIAYRPTVSRDFTIFTAPVRGRGIVSLSVRDPYGAAGSENRAALIDFVRLLKESARSVSGVCFTTYDADSVETYPPEDQVEQWNDLFRKWDDALPDVSKPKFIRLSRRSVRGFHDREISAQLEDGSSLIWDLGNGVEAIFNKRRECRVVLTVQ